VGAGRRHWEEDIVQVGEGAGKLAVVASDPYSVKQTWVGHWEAAYQADNASVACMVLACMHRVDREEASQASWVVRDKHRDMVHRRSHGLLPGPPHTREGAWAVGPGAPYGEIAVEHCAAAEGTTVHSACRYKATMPKLVWLRRLCCA